MLFQEVRQIDLTPTLALALGLPIPYSNLGIPILDLFEHNKPEAVRANFLQMINFINQYKHIASEELLNADELQNANMNNSLDNLLSYLNVIQEKCREKWSTFNINHCLIGIFLLILSIVSLLLILNIINSKKTHSLDELTINLAKTSSLMLAIYFVLAFCLSLNAKFSIWILGLAFNFYFILKHASQFAPISLKFINKQSIILLLVYLIPFSNSFIIRENNSLRFLLMSVLAVDFYTKLNIYKPSLSGIARKASYIVPILFLIRISHVFYICREEVLTLNCTQTIFSTQLSKLSYSAGFYFIFLLSNFVCISFIVYRVSKSNGFLKLTYIYYTQVVLLFVYFMVQLRLNLISNSELNQSEEWSILKHFNLNLARFNYFLFLSAQLLIWSSAFSRNSLKLNNLITSLGLLMTQVAGESMLSVWLLILVINLYFEYLSSWSYEKPEIKLAEADLDPIVFLFVLGYFYFYASGHETVFTHIKWEAGFNGFDGDNNNRLVRLIMAGLIVANTFSALILSSLAIGFVRMVPFGLKSNKNVASSVLKFYLYTGLKVGCFI